MRMVIGVTLGAIVVFAIGLMIYLGAYKPVEMEARNAGPFRMVYMEHVGPYYKIMGAITAVEKNWAPKAGERCELSFGEYLDDPKQVDEDRLRSNGGCLVEKDWSFKLPEGFHYREIPVRFYLVAKFQGAPSIGPYKVYPKAQKWISENGYTQKGGTIEIYRIISANAVETEYYFPIEKAVAGL